MLEQDRKCIDPLAFSSGAKQIFDFLTVELTGPGSGSCLLHLRFKSCGPCIALGHRSPNSFIRVRNRGRSTTKTIRGNDKLSCELAVAHCLSDIGLPAQAEFKIAPPKCVDALSKKHERKKHRAGANERRGASAILNDEDSNSSRYDQSHCQRSNP